MVRYNCRLSGWVQPKTSVVIIVGVVVTVMVVPATMITHREP